MLVWLTATCVPVLVQQNINGSDFFNRSWAEFKVGFNDTLGNYWLGNDLLSQLTLSRRYKLRVDLQLRNCSWYYAEYSSFLVYGESRNYELRVSGFSGNAGDALSNNVGRMFTTYDRDNGLYSEGNCAVIQGGGFWYVPVWCGSCTVNTVRGHYFRWSSPTTESLLLQSSRMRLIC